MKMRQLQPVTPGQEVQLAASEEGRAGRQDQIMQMKTAGTCMATPQKKKKSSGVSPESFHKPLHKLSSSIPSTTNAGSGSKPAADSADSRRRMGASSATVEYEERLRKTLRSIGTSVDYRDLAGRYERFKNQSTYSKTRKPLTLKYDIFNLIDID